MAVDSESKPSSKPLVGTQQTQTAGDKAFQGLASLIKLLPTGTVFLFQFLSPVLTNNGHCSPINKFLTGALLFFSGLSCVFSCFTDSYTGKDGRIHYGVVTTKGLWAFSDPDAKSMDLSPYKLQLGDFAHALLALIVSAVVALFDSNTVGCYYSSFETEQKALLMALPPVVGAISSTVFVVFPNTRHGIGYPATPATAVEESFVAV
ncbi:hypothetical protein AAC387_Pa03g2259 [Persea americana]